MAARTTRAITIRASWARLTARAETAHLHPVDGLSHRRHISFQDGDVGLKFGHEGVGLLGRQVRVVLKPPDGVVKTAPVVGIEGGQGRRLGLEVWGQVNILRARVATLPMSCGMAASISWYFFRYSCCFSGLPIFKK